PDRKESPKRRSRRLENDPLQLLSPEQTAELLCVSRSTVDRLVHSGRLPYVRLMAGKRKMCYAIRRTSLEKWNDENETTAKKPEAFRINSGLTHFVYKNLRGQLSADFYTERYYYIIIS